MKNEEKRQLENIALKLKQQGISYVEIEKQLQHEFIFYQEPITQKYINAILWK